MKKKKSIVILLTLVILSPLFTQEDISLYDLGIENYKSKKNEKALELLQEFRLQNPDHTKADDALWYTGRLYERLDRVADAEEVFREVLTIQDSNRLAEAKYDLSQILYSKRNYVEILEILGDLPEMEQADSYELRSMEILGDSLYALGNSFRSDYKHTEAAENYIYAAEVYEVLLGFLVDEKNRSNVLYSLGKSYRRLATLGLNKESYESYYKKSIDSLFLSDNPGAVGLIEDLTNDRKINLKLKAELLAGLESIGNVPGFDLKADISASFPLAFNVELITSLNYVHDDFSFKTFNFDPTKTENTRLIQSTDKISTDLILKTGNIRTFQNTLELNGSYRLAEDFGDNYYSLSFSEDGLLRINSAWKTGWKSDFSWKVFPDYLVGGHKIDSIQGDFEPYVQWYFSDKSDLTFNYGINVKQYLEAKYDTADPLVSSTEDRQYLSNKLGIELDSKLSGIIDTKLSYEILILESTNYDVWITDKNAVDIFIEDYNDYLQHTVKSSLDFQWSDRLRTDLDGSIEIRKFTNYIARDVNGIFLSQEVKREDLTFSVSGEIGFVIWESPKGIEAELVGKAWYDKSVSNMQYEVSFDTNSEIYSGLLGVKLRMP
jgi:tetratricopeptide (TPR) repeat protein